MTLDATSDSSTRCPGCGQQEPPGAQVCRRCGREIDALTHPIPVQRGAAPAAQRRAAFDELRGAVEHHRAAIVVLGRDVSQRAQLRREVAALQQELVAAAPNPAAVRERWQAVLEVVGPRLAELPGPAAVTEIVERACA